jgi:hypothetical protein
MLAQAIISIFSFVVMTFIFVFTTYLVYYFIFAKNNFWAKRKVQNKINKIIAENNITYEKTKIEKINGVWFLIDKEKNKYYAI